MIAIERQVHGYRQGHQLLAASVQLPKEDQSVVDRLSDVAGPLRPREKFESYLTAYPLPSGERFVLARTWQDLTVARAGCVRTLSLIIPMKAWADADGLDSFLDLVAIDRLPDSDDATSMVVETGPATPLAPVVGFNCGELLEALFLEESRPVVVLDAAEPELIATRLLTALWPSLRRKFALSTFALSPRKVSGRDFDLMFAPKGARSKFADWNGRRVDGRSTQANRHRWTGAIVSRVFDQPFPRLLSDNEIGLVGGGVRDVDVDDDAAALRIALLWDELVAKLDSTPSAALGLLDIANSGKLRDARALEAIEPSLARATRLASKSLPASEAWTYLGAISRKLLSQTMPVGRAAVADAVEDLAGRAPEGAVTFLSQDDPRGVVADLLPRIASGIGSNFTDRSEQALLGAHPQVLGSLLAEGGVLVESVAGDGPLVVRLSDVLPQLDDETLDRIERVLLPLLIDDWQVPAAEPLIARLSPSELAIELQHLGMVNDFGSEQLSDIVLNRALAASPRETVRSTLSALSRSERRDALIARTLLPEIEDARWLVTGGALDESVATTLLVALLRQADKRQLLAIIADGEVGDRAVEALWSHEQKVLFRLIVGDGLPLPLFVQLAPRTLEVSSGEDKVKLAKHVLGRCLGNRFGGNEIEFLASTLGMIGDQLDGAWAARIGLSRNVDGAIASRNMIAFSAATQPARLRVVWSIAEVAQVLRDRQAFDLDTAAIGACAAFMVDAEKVTPKAMLAASGYLLPTLLRAGDRPVSPLIAAAFPPIHREFAKADEAPDFLRFVPFFDWDRCKAARHELVDAFMSSSWPPGDLALTACRANEVVRVMRRVFKQRGGAAYLKRIALDLDRLPEKCRNAVKHAITQIRSNPSAKYDWRD